MDIQRDFATDEKLETEGAWIKRGDAEFLIARAGNRKFARALAAEIEDHQDVLEGKDDAADKCSDEIMGRVMSKTILLGWRGNVQFAGEAVTYSSTQAEQMLAAHKDFRKWVNSKADEREHYRVKVEKQLGNA